MSIDDNNMPYPGLRPYQENEKGKFFGRDADAEILIDKLLTNRLTLLFAASGVGKSSLLQAAVIPYLKSKTGENLTVVYHIDWVSDPVRSVRNAVLQALYAEELLLEDSGEVEFGETLPELVEFCGMLVRPPLILILDQFEEFFRYQRHQAGFKTLIDQLTTIITDKSLPVHLVFSMREDFALELNAFKPKLPTILFENFYRLEKLGREAVRDAIVIPVEQRGFTYESDLLEQLLTDLLSREMDRQPGSPMAKLLETVEPPYLQIVCAHLWKLNKDDPEKTLRLVSYEKAGQAQGILKNYLDGVLQQFSFSEKQLVSQAFDHLVSLRGVKMAYTARALAELLRVDKEELAGVLGRLEKVAVLRRQQRDDELWYELYHDMFSGSIEDWNNAWKDRMRRRRSAKVVGGVVFGVAAIFAGWDYYANVSNYHFRLSPRGEVAQVELWQGKPGTIDFFDVQKYKTETSVSRVQLEPDKRFEKRLVENYETLQQDLQGSKSVEERIVAYSEIGSHQESLGLAEMLIISKRVLSAKRGLWNLRGLKTTSAVELIYKIFENSKNTSIKTDISGGLQSDSKIFSIATGVSLLKSKNNRYQGIIKSQFSDNEKALWINVLLSQSVTDFANHEISKFSKKTMDRFQTVRFLLSQPNSADSIALASVLAKEAKTYKIRHEANFALATFGEKKVIPELISLLSNESQDTRRNAIRALLELGSMEAIPNLIKLLDDQEDSVRIAAAQVLGKLNARASIPDLIKLVNDRNNNVRIAAIEALRHLEATEVTPMLILLLKDREQQVRATAANTLGWFKVEEAIPKMLDLLLKNRYGGSNNDFVDALSNFTLDQVIPELLKALRKPDKYQRNDKINLLLAKLALNEEMIPELIEQLKDENSKVRVYAAIALKQLKAKIAIPELIKSLKDFNSNSSSSKAISETLGFLGADQAIPELESSLSKSLASQRLSAVKALGKLKAKKSVPALINTLFNDEDYYIRASAAKALANIWHTPIIPELIRLLDDDSSYIRDTATKALGLLGSRQAIPKLESLLEYNDSSIIINDRVRTSAALALSLLGQNEVLPGLLSNLKRQVPSHQADLNIIRVRELVKTDWGNIKLMPYLFPIINDVEKSSKYDLPNLESASRIASGELLDFLLVRLKNHNREISESATISAFRMLRNNNLNQIQKQLLQKALTQIKKETLEAAKKRLAEEDQLEAEEKAEVLGNPVNQPGLEEKPLSLKELSQKLNEQNQAYADWRKHRDTKQAQTTNTEEDPISETTNSLKEPAPFIYEYAYAIAYESEKEGVKLLGHNLYKVREAAARGLANGDTLGVELLKKLEKEWLATNDPIERQGLYHAIDIALLALEGIGYKKELTDLKAYETTLTNKRSIASIKPRVEWTRIQLQWRVDANQELEELAARQLPKLLKEYCLNEDGTDMKQEECAIEN